MSATPEYSKGYSAGRKRGRLDAQLQRHDDEREKFRRQAFLAALPWAMACDGWKMGEVQVQTSEQRIELARRVAEKAATKFFG